MPDIVRMMRENETAVRLESVYAVNNVCGHGTPEQVDFLVSHGLLRNLVHLLSDPGPHLILASLVCLNSVFKRGDEIRQLTASPSNIYYVRFAEFRGMQKLGDLVEHQDDRVYELAFELGAEHFPETFQNLAQMAAGDQRQMQNNNNNNTVAGGGASVATTSYSSVSISPSYNNNSNNNNNNDVNDNDDDDDPPSNND